MNANKLPAVLRQILGCGCELVAAVTLLIVVSMSYSDWARWCNESSSVALSSNLTRLNSVSFAAVAAYALTVALAAFFILRWARLKKQSQNELWHGFKW